MGRSGETPVSIFGQDHRNSLLLTKSAHTNSPASAGLSLFSQAPFGVRATKDGANPSSRNGDNE